MPYIHISTNVDLSIEDKVKIKDKLAELLPILPEKNIHNALVHIDGGEYMHFAAPEDKCAFCDLRLYTESPQDAKDEFVEKLYTYLEEEYGISPKRFYMNITELDTWTYDKKNF